MSPQEPAIVQEIAERVCDYLERWTKIHSAPGGRALLCMASLADLSLSDCEAILCVQQGGCIR